MVFVTLIWFLEVSSPMSVYCLVLRVHTVLFNQVCFLRRLSGRRPTRTLNPSLLDLLSLELVELDLERGLVAMILYSLGEWLTVQFRVRSLSIRATTGYLTHP
jgi:hypothetical protein